MLLKFYFFLFCFLGSHFALCSHFDEKEFNADSEEIRQAVFKRVSSAEINFLVEKFKKYNALPQRLKAQKLFKQCYIEAAKINETSLMFNFILRFEQARGNKPLSKDELADLLKEVPKESRISKEISEFSNARYPVIASEISSSLGGSVNLPEEHYEFCRAQGLKVVSEKKQKLADLAKDMEKIRELIRGKVDLEVIKIQYAEFLKKHQKFPNERKILDSLGKFYLDGAKTGLFKHMLYFLAEKENLAGTSRRNEIAAIFNSFVFANMPLEHANQFVVSRGIELTKEEMFRAFQIAVLFRKPLALGFFAKNQIDFNSLVHQKGQQPMRPIDLLVLENASSIIDLILFVRLIDLGSRPSKEFFNDTLKYCRRNIKLKNASKKTLADELTRVKNQLLAEAFKARSILAKE